MQSLPSSVFYLDEMKLRENKPSLYIVIIYKRDSDTDMNDFQTTT